jgi:hypothetical protein
MHGVMMKFTDLQKECAMRFAKYLMFAWFQLTLFCSLPHLFVAVSAAQMIDNTQAPNTAKAGINKSLLDEIGAGRGSVLTPDSSIYIINRDPFRSIRRGRQLFQRKFTHLQGQGPNEKDGVGDINTDLAIGAGLSDSCALCHGRPRGSAGAGGNVVTRPDSRDAGHLFGLVTSGSPPKKVNRRCLPHVYCSFVCFAPSCSTTTN